MSDFFSQLFSYLSTSTPASQEPAILDLFKQWTSYLAAGVEASAAFLIGFAAIEATVGWINILLHRGMAPEAPENVRLRLGRWLALALEFETAADILRTAIAPSWNDILQLAAIITLRTALNYFLQREIDKAAERRSNVPT